ncbi:MAG: hypothetical protein JWO03_2871 [Bacteroidetes bacterium]|nr:hypothetical protein [Bacteroidota bacterium]
MKRLIIPAIAAALLMACTNHEKEYTQFKSHPTMAPDTATQQTVFDIQQLVHKSPADIAVVFGAPEAVVGKPADNAGMKNIELEARYKNHVTVLYSQDKAVWFEFNPLHDIEWKDKLKAFGLEDRKPDDLIGGDTEWYKKYKGIKQISFTQNKQFHHLTAYAIVEAP